MNRLLTACLVWVLALAPAWAQFNGVSGIYALNHMTFGLAANLTIVGPGTGYVANDTITLDCTPIYSIGTRPVITVNTVNVAGGITAATVTNAGLATQIPSTGLAGGLNGVCTFTQFSTSGSGVGTQIFGTFGFLAAAPTNGISNTTPISGISSGDILYSNGGFVGGLSTTGSGPVVQSNSPALTTPALGTPSAVNLTNGLSLPIAGVTGWGTNVAAAVGANWASNIQAFLTAGWGTNVAGAAETTLNTTNGLAAYISGSGAPLNVVNCTIPAMAAVNTLWCPWAPANTGLVPSFFDTISVNSYATCSTNQPSVQVFNTANSSGAGTTTASNTPNTVVTTSINAGIATSAANAGYAFKITTAGVGCATTLPTGFISVSVTFRGG
jgi:hypothetical protein